MQLIKFQLFSGDKLIRDIPFKKGLNIITNQDAAGNQIGKSTALRAIDFCLGGDIHQLWTDPETKAANKDVKQFLTSGNVVFHLVVSINGYQSTITRCATLKGRQIRILSTIDGTEYTTDTSFQQVLPSTLGHTVARPTFKQIKRRFFRVFKKSSNQTLKYLHSYTSDDEYRFVNLYLFGFDGEDKLQKEYKLNKRLSDIQSRRKAILNARHLAHYEKQLASIDKEIQILSEKEEAIDITGVQESVIQKLQEVRSKIANLSSSVSYLEIRLVYYKKTIDEYENKVQQVDTQTIRNIYEEAKALIPDLSKSFEETVAFHNSMLESKARYVKDQVEKIEKELTTQRLELRAHLKNEERLVKEVAAAGQLDGFILIEKAIQEQREKRGQVNFVVLEVKRIDSESEHLDSELKRLRAINEELENSFNNKIAVFNKEYTPLAQNVFGVPLKLEKESSDDGKITFSIQKEDEISGDGAPRAAAMTFELALVKYSQETNSKLPQFTMQDYIEAVDDDKIEKLFNFANKNKAQTIVAVLSYKLHPLGEKFCDSNTVLTLSQADKFFKV
ncbi:conserved protein of unknown function [Pseudodesulfovibrio profundus]|uniref:DUF2326 domain-containing protein n=1 Tax=Pseudodesulfovibrio profundus TaxID=57320 RepID=A0A2C8F704_9BACT|nr:AAA family ATPase [Pseudodesulfovibrio profundus]SOB58170.1 conserved protein of unknown function [Pseudodesulfovibrio profundus]